MIRPRVLHACVCAILLAATAHAQKRIALELSDGQPEDFVTAVTAAGGTVWAGSENGALYRFDVSATGPVAPISSASQLKGKRIQCMSPGRESIWIGTARGLFVFDTAQG
ncbi:MAG: PQQ-binding-like beta-propeller repeat protein, partial [Chitinivibrionales bacterium]|nr:PQQ-binding-like beta-propeller repeat protein [Chitinivibrionales bacterium]MBD3396268.1 PQQ-binding-like beta-propeller repeat protein [Chitinivibrionales bacterium]